MPPIDVQHLWAKSDRGGGSGFHPLACHLADVAAVADLLWREVLRDSVRKRFSRVLSLDEESAGRWFAFWVGCHDIGKACPGFQSKCPAFIPKLIADGFDFRGCVDVPHGTVSTRVLIDLLPTGDGWPEVPKSLARRIAIAVGGHHGYFPASEAFDNDKLKSRGLGRSGCQRSQSHAQRHLLRQGLQVE